MPPKNNVSESVQTSLRLACRWLIEAAQVNVADLADDPQGMKAKFAYRDWRGAIRGEYRHSTRQWSFFAIWHVGQAVRGLVQAARVLKDPSLLEAAKRSGQFILNQQLQDVNDEDFGLIYAYEDDADRINISAILEGLSGLVELFHATGEGRWLQAAHAAARWTVQKAYIPNEGLFKDCYDPRSRTFAEHRFGTFGRPLADDAILLVLGNLRDDAALKATFFQVLERLLKDEDPPGNWIRYAPCNAERGSIHPRHAFWWGLPFLDGYQATGEKRYLDAVIRAGRWYVQAQRRDGGLFRGTYRDFTTDSFGHATSGIACAVKMWARLWKATGDREWLEPIRRGLAFGRKMQITKSQDPNLQGTVVEKILDPDGTDQSLIYNRDLGTIFYIQAVCETIENEVEDVLSQ